MKCHRMIVPLIFCAGEVRTTRGLLLRAGGSVRGGAEMAVERRAGRDEGPGDGSRDYGPREERRRADAGKDRRSGPNTESGPKKDSDGGGGGTKTGREQQSSVANAGRGKMTNDHRNSENKETRTHHDPENNQKKGDKTNGGDNAKDGSSDLGENPNDTGATTSVVEPQCEGTISPANDVYGTLELLTDTSYHCERDCQCMFKDPSYGCCMWYPGSSQGIHVCMHGGKPGRQGELPSFMRRYCAGN